MTLSIGSINWDTIERLRRGFIEGQTTGDYWRKKDDLELYDLTFGRRISWKWDYVLDELTKLNWKPPEGTILDWACGSGVAGRTFLQHFGTDGTRQIVFHDKSTLAMQVAARLAERDFAKPAEPTEFTTQAKPVGPTESARSANLKISTALSSGQACPAVLLVSHVITELSPEQLQLLVALAQQAQTVIWVEPGTHQASRALAGVRDQLRENFQTIAPCTHNGPCRMLDEQNSRHWCHHFAAPPKGIFGNGEWVKFGQAAGIDLRSLPLSYIVMDKRPAAVPAGLSRTIGRPRVYNAYALLFSCEANCLQDRRLMKRHLPAQFKDLQKGRLVSLHRWRCEGLDIIEELPI
jgi:hypothetical protein